MRGEARLQIKATPERLWQMVSDVPRMGQWSPETKRGEWVDGATGPSVGARFRGYNRFGPMKWSTVSTVKAAEPGREFAFVTDYKHAWRYRFEPSGDGTIVTESYDVPTTGVLAAVFKLIGRDKNLNKAMQQTLARLKAAAESE